MSLFFTDKRDVEDGHTKPRTDTQNEEEEYWDNTVDPSRVAFVHNTLK